MVLGLLVDAVVRGDLLQAVGVGGGVEADEAGEDERGDQTGDPQRAPGGARRDRRATRRSMRPFGRRSVHQRAVHAQLQALTQVARAVHEIRAHGDHRAHRQRRDRRLADADEEVHADHRARDLADRDIGRAADRVHQREGERRRRDRDHRGDEARDGHRTAGARQHLHQAAEEAVGDDGRDDRHVGDVHTERGQPAVGEEDALHQQDHGHAQHTRVGADEDRGERAAEQMAAGPRRDREVQHLHREDERGHQAGQRRGAFVELAARAAQAHGDRGRGDRSGRERGRGVYESVRHMHRSMIVACCEWLARAWEKEEPARALCSWERSTGNVRHWRESGFTAFT